MRKSFVVAMLLAMVLNILIPVVRPVATRAESVILPSHVVQDTKNHLSQVVRSSRSTTANADGDSVFAVSLPIYLPSTSWTETSIGASTVPVSITESGFDPATVIVTVGTTVEWTNRTGETQQIVANVGGYEIFLPLVLRNASSTLASVDAPSLTLNAVPLSFSAGGFDWSSGPLAPGESYTYTFITTGDFSYFLSAYPDLTGVVIVQEEAPPDFDISITPAVQTVTQGETTTYTVTLTAVGGFASPVTLSATGLPVGATADWSQNPATPDATVVLTVTTAPSTSISDHLFTVTGMGGGQNHNAQATLTVKAAPQTPDFELGAWPATQTITRGHSINYTVAVTAVHGFTQAITLDAGGYTTGTAIAWTTNPLTPTADTTLTITPSASGPTGTFTLVITGTSNPVHTTQVELVVVEKSIPPVPDFFLNVTPRSRSIVQGQTTSYDVALTAIYGFTNTVSLEVGGLPAGATPAWDENPLTPSASTVMTVTTADTTPTGNYTLVITGTGGGISRTDSVQLSVNPPPMPNLVVRSIETDPEVPVANQPFEIQVGIANTGTAYALGDFLVDWYADPSTPPISTTSGDGTWTRSGLGTGRTILLTTTYTLTTAGTHTFYAQIDRTNVVTESDEMDNLTGPLTLIASVMPQPDLVVIGLSVAPTIPTLGQPVTLTVQIKNRGTLSTTADVRVDGYVDPVAVPGAGETGDVFTTIASLDPGQSVVVQLPYTFTTGEQHTLYAQVDALDVVSESIENNNVSEPLTVTPYVPQPDLVTERILLNPVAPFAGDTVTATVTIRNQGDTDAGPFRADWYVDPASPPVAGQTGDGYWNVPSLAVGAAIDLTLTHSFAATDTHWIYVQVDPMDAITESVETNNVGGEPLTVVGRSEDVCGNITADTTWYANTLYRVICDVTVMSDVTLTVNPGVVAQFGLSNYLRVYGTLNAVGTSEMPVLFTSSQGAPAREYWGGVMFENNSKGYLEYIIVEYGNSVYVQSSDVQITNSTIRYSKNDGISISNASPEISDSIITDNDSSGVRVSVGSPVLSGCIISNNDYLGIDIDHASPTVSGCTIAYNGDNGIDVFDSGSGSGENSSPIISGCSIANNNGVGIDLSGIQLVDGLPVVSGNTISSNADYAVRVKVDKLSAAFANANTFSGNGQDAVYVLANGQYLTGTHTWPSWLSDYPLHISERFSINSSGVL
ncbi:MAG: hypothetical protein GY832_42755, partial [Chloroflexi bacterium]|nr:hypothetical protein [Chloroflexota bacterium]